MDIRSFGEANVRKFFEMGLIKDIPGVYTLDFEKIKELEGFGEKSITNLHQAIEKSKTQPCTGLYMRWVYAMLGKPPLKHWLRTYPVFTTWQIMI
jgi:NAD-dependent DNA ligase